MTLPELIEDIEQQFSECPCGDCLAKIDYECEPPFGCSNNGELLFPEVRPVYFYCAIKDETLNTDEMKGKQCDIKKHKKKNNMTDKVQKIKEWISRTQDGLMDANGNFLYPEHEGAFHILCNLDYYIDSLKEEPVSEDLNIEPMIESYKQRLLSQANGMKNSPLIDMCLSSYKHGINETLDTLKLSNVERTVNGWEEQPVSEVLEKAIDTYLATYFGDEKEKQEWPFLKKMAIYFANWQRSQLMRNAIEVVISDDTIICNAVEVMKLREMFKGQKVKITVIKDD